VKLSTYCPSINSMIRRSHDRQIHQGRDWLLAYAPARLVRCRFVLFRCLYSLLDLARSVLHDPRKPAAPLQPAPPQMPRCRISMPCRRTKHHHRVRALRRQRVEGERDLNLPDERPQRSLVPYQRGRGKWPRARRLSYRPVEGRQDLAVRANPSGFLSATVYTATSAINH